MLPPTARRSLVAWCMPPSMSSVVVFQGDTSFHRYVQPAAYNGQHAADNTQRTTRCMLAVVFHSGPTPRSIVMSPRTCRPPTLPGRTFRARARSTTATAYRRAAASSRSAHAQCSAARIVFVASRWKVVASLRNVVACSNYICLQRRFPSARNRIY